MDIVGKCANETYQRRVPAVEYRQVRLKLANVVVEGEERVSLNHNSRESPARHPNHCCIPRVRDYLYLLSAFSWHRHLPVV